MRVQRQYLTPARVQCAIVWTLLSRLCVQMRMRCAVLFRAMPVQALPEDAAEAVEVAVEVAVVVAGAILAVRQAAAAAATAAAAQQLLQTTPAVLPLSCNGPPVLLWSTRPVQDCRLV